MFFLLNWKLNAAAVQTVANFIVYGVENKEIKSNYKFLAHRPG